MISIEKIYKKFDKIEVLKGLNLEIKQSGIFAILGPNGSGKTTLIKSILGMVVPNNGSIFFQNKNIIGKSSYRTQISYLPQIANFPTNLTVKELIKLAQDLKPIDSMPNRLIELFGLKSFLNKKLGELSGGTKQKVNIVLTFMFDSPLIILDEPTTGLDPIALIHLKTLIKKEKAKGKTILITTHIMSVVEELADEIIFLLNGTIYFKGSVNSLKEKTETNHLENAIANLISKQNV